MYPTAMQLKFLSLREHKKAPACSVQRALFVDWSILSFISKNSHMYEFMYATPIQRAVSSYTKTQKSSSVQHAAGIRHWLVNSQIYISVDVRYSYSTKVSSYTRTQSSGVQRAACIYFICLEIQANLSWNPTIYTHSTNISPSCKNIEEPQDSYTL